MEDPHGHLTAQSFTNSSEPLGWTKHGAEHHAFKQSSITHVCMTPRAHTKTGEKMRSYIHANTYVK